MCFWATRYDCFADTDEFKLGVETIRRLLPEMEKELQPDRQIAPLFDWNEIKDNKNLPYPAGGLASIRSVQYRRSG